jgi:hypothetical protein
MMNKKLIALLVAIATVGAVTTRCLADGFFGNLGKATGGLVEDTGRTVGNVPTRLTTGESIQEIQDRHDAERTGRMTRRERKQQERQENREAARRDDRQYYRD